MRYTPDVRACIQIAACFALYGGLVALVAVIRRRAARAARARSRTTS